MALAARSFLMVGSGIITRSQSSCFAAIKLLSQNSSRSMIEEWLTRNKSFKQPTSQRPEHFFSISSSQGAYTKSRRILFKALLFIPQFEIANRS